MTAERRCEKCGATLATFGTEALCPNCMLHEAIGLEAEPSSWPAAASVATAAAVVVKPVTEKLGDRIGRYKLLQQIGEGGMGAVYMAEQESPVRRHVALKVIKLGMDTKNVIARFEAERQALALMDHPNIAKALDAGATDAGRPYFVMELVRGIRITDYCDQNHLTTQQRLGLFTQVCKAIQHAHQKGIIHRDIKPSNILVTLHDGVPVTKIIDFGVAKATSDQRLTDKTLFTAFQQFIGTPAYMSPEQAEMSGLDVDTRSDIYSLGVLLYELLTGVTPFDADELLHASLDEMRRKIREDEPRKPSTRLSTMGLVEAADVTNRFKISPTKLATLVRGDLDWIVMKALEKDRSRRYDTANGLAMDIQRHLTNEPVLARPPSRLYEFQKTVRRHKVGFATTAVVILTLAVGVVVSTWQAIEANRSKHEAEEARLAEQHQRIVLQRERDNATSAQEVANQERTTAQRHLYVANMNLAQQAWEQNNVGRVHQLLEETAAYPQRGFEWYYWQRQTHLELKILRGHTAGVRAVAFSPDGQGLVTGSLDQTAKVWDAASGKELLTLKGHSAGILSVAFSPHGEWIVTGSLDQTAKVWEAASGKELLTLKGHTALITCVAFSPNGQRIVTGSGDRTAKVWDAASGKELLTLKNHGAVINSVAFSPDGHFILTGSGDQTAKMWETSHGNQLLTLKGHSAPINTVAFSPDGQRIVTGSDDATAKVWKTSSGKELLTLKGHSAAISSVAFSPDGQRMITGSLDQTAKAWEATSGKELFTLRGHSDRIYAVAFSPQGQQIVTGSEDQTAKVWEALSGKEQLTLKGHRAVINSVAFSPDGQRIATGGADETARVWDAMSAKELLTLKGHTALITCAAFSPDGHRIATCSYDQTAMVWEAGSGKELLTFKGHSAAITWLAFSPDGRRIVTGSYDQTAKLWEAASGKELLTLRGHIAPILAVAFSPDGQRIVTGSSDHTAKVWEAASGKELRTLSGHTAPILAVAFSPDGSRIVTASWDRTAKVWEVDASNELLTLKGHSAGLRSVVFSRDGQRIITGSYDQTAKVWEAASAKELLTLKGHTDLITCVAFSPDGQRIVTSSGDQTAKVWDAASPEQAAAWQGEEKSAAGHLTGLQREWPLAAERDRVVRSQDQGAIKQWLLLAPISFEGRNGAVALEHEQILQEARLRPAAGERVGVNGSQRIWRAVQLEDYRLDLNQLLGEMTQWSVAYAVCYIQSSGDQSGLVLKVGSDDQAKIYLNGKEIYRRLEAHEYVADQDVAAGLELKAGANVLVFKIVNETASWQGSIRFTDAAGNPLKGIKVSLTP